MRAGKMKNGGLPFGAAVLRLKESERERIRRAILISTNESDGEIAARLTPPSSLTW